MALTTRRDRNEINVTPLIDVLLVLLVIFLIVMPSVTTYHDVQTPDEPAHGVTLPHLVVRVRADASIILVDEGREIALEAGEVPAGLRAHLRENTHAVFVEIEDGLLWGHVISTVDTIRGVAPKVRIAFAEMQ